LASLTLLSLSIIAALHGDRKVTKGSVLTQVVVFDVREVDSQGHETAPRALAPFKLDKTIPIEFKEPYSIEPFPLERAGDRSAERKPWHVGQCHAERQGVSCASWLLVAYELSVWNL
jgi:hypothetical protein